ncbi:hypothetical protein [Corynebacterium lowii]|nr:hypothetical protein [Corynebacterium lowii]MDP9851398.1 hypothetical protein [Corynebacterium lowii]
MNFSASAKALIAAAVVTPLVLSGCSSDSGDSEDTSTAAATTSASSQAASASAAPSTSAAPAPANTASASPAAPPQAAAASAQQSAPPAAVQAQGQQGAQGGQNQDQQNQGQQGQPLPAQGDNSGLPIATVDPIPSGQPANAQDSEAIRTLVTGFNNETTMRRKMEYLPEHTCSRVIQENGGPEAFDFSAIPDVDLNQMPGGEQYDSSVAEVRDIVVDGDQASATVVANTNNGPSEATQRFSRENGSWTFCN